MAFMIKLRDSRARALSADERAELEQLAKDQAPIVYLHPDEPFYPSSVDWYLSRVRLVNTLGGVRKIVADVGTLNGSNLIERRNVDDKLRSTHDRMFDGANPEWLLSIPDDATKAGERTPPDVPVKVESYVQINAWPNQPIVDFQYWLFYPYNGNIGRVPVLNIKIKAGAHESDWEHLIVRYNTATKQVVTVFYSAHGGDNRWCHTDQWKDPETGRPRAYAAVESHANYWSVGRQKRDSFGANLTAQDHTGKGARWDLADNLVFVDNDRINASNSWLGFSGRWGASAGTTFEGSQSPEGPAFKAEWCTEDVNVVFPVVKEAPAEMANNHLFGGWSSTRGTPALIHEQDPGTGRSYLTMYLCDGDGRLHTARCDITEGYEGANWPDTPTLLFSDWSDAHAAPNVVMTRNGLVMAHITGSNDIRLIRRKQFTLNETDTDWTTPVPMFNNWRGRYSSPTFAVLRDQIYIGLLSIHGEIFIARRPDDGREIHEGWVEPRRLFTAQGWSDSGAGPNLAVLDEQLVMSLITGDGQICVAQTTDANAFAFTEPKELFAKWSNIGSAPQLISYDGVLYMCLLNDHSAIFAAYSTDGVNWPDKQTIEKSRIFMPWSNLFNRQTPRMVEINGAVYFCLINDKGQVFVEYGGQLATPQGG